MPSTQNGVRAADRPGGVPTAANGLSCAATTRLSAGPVLMVTVMVMVMVMVMAGRRLVLA
jgi:hypothetical protein